MKTLLSLSLIFLATMVRADEPAVLEDILKLRDPFKLPASIIENTRPRTILEKFPTHKYRMLGVITGRGKVKAMILDPDGKTHFVAENDRIGVREGTIQNITAEKITVRERIMNVLGIEESVITEIKLPPPGEKVSVNSARK